MPVCKHEMRVLLLALGSHHKFLSLRTDPTVNRQVNFGLQFAPGDRDNIINWTTTLMALVTREVVREHFPEGGGSRSLDTA